eukprot:763595-Hanusia_phi.AAC.1
MAAQAYNAGSALLSPSHISLRQLLLQLISLFELCAVLSAPQYVRQSQCLAGSYLEREIICAVTVNANPSCSFQVSVTSSPMFYTFYIMQIYYSPSVYHERQYEVYYNGVKISEGGAETQGTYTNPYLAMYYLYIVKEIPTCKRCEVGKYSSFSAASACASCPAYSNTTTTGATSINACACLPGYIGMDGEDCSICPAGKYKTGSNPGSC